MSAALFIVIPNWDEFQHYKDRRPVWIKNYTELTTDRKYMSLTLRQRGILHGIWLLYAASRRDLGANVAQLGRMLGEETVRTRDLEALSDAGFIELSASAPLATRYQPASPDKEKERDVEAEDLPPEGSPVKVKVKVQTSSNGARANADDDLDVTPATVTHIHHAAAGHGQGNGLS
jgi:hypothetical protein